MLDISKKETILIIMTYFMRHNLSKIALLDLLKLINLIIGIQSLPESHYKFMKYCTQPFEFSKQYYCSKCKLFFGHIIDENLLKNFVCSNAQVKNKNILFQIVSKTN